MLLPTPINLVWGFVFKTPTPPGQALICCCQNPHPGGVKTPTPLGHQGSPHRALVPWLAQVPGHKPWPGGQGVGPARVGGPVPAIKVAKHAAIVSIKQHNQHKGGRAAPTDVKGIAWSMAGPFPFVCMGH